MKKVVFIFIPAALLAFVPYITHIMLEGVKTPIDTDDFFAVITLFVIAVYLRYTVYISRQKLKDKGREFERVSATAAPLIEDGIVIGAVEGFRDATQERGADLCLQRPQPLN